MSFTFNERITEVRWSRGYCGEAGCTDPDCVCALCVRPIGIPEDDPRWRNHDADCFGCELCEDDAIPDGFLRRAAAPTGQVLDGLY